MADYIVLLTTGRVVTIAGVTATPTMVQNDGTATKIKGPPYRNVFNTYWVGDPEQTGFRKIPTYAGGPPPAVTAYEIIKDDVTAFTAPRQGEEEWTHWKFIIAGPLSYFIPVKYVVAMATALTE